MCRLPKKTPHRQSTNVSSKQQFFPPKQFPHTHKKDTLCIVLIALTSHVVSIIFQQPKTVMECLRCCSKSALRISHSVGGEEQRKHYATIYDLNKSKETAKQAREEREKPPEKNTNKRAASHASQNNKTHGICCLW